MVSIKNITSGNLILCLKILPLLSLPLLSSCSSNSSNEMKGEVVSVLANIQDTYNTSQFIEDISFIPLETKNSCIIGGVRKLIKADNKYFIFDGVSMKFFVFNHEGKYLYSFGNLGRGPGEYSNMIDFTVDLNNRCILILDNYNKIIKSDLHGNLIAEKSLPKENRHFLNSIHVFNGTLFAYTGQESANEKKYQVIRFDEDLDPVDYLFPYTFSFPAVRSFGNALYTFDNNLNFVSEWGFSIYQLRGGKFEERYSLDFSGKELSLEGITLEEFAKNKTHSYLFSTCVEGDDAIFLPIFAEERPMYGFLLKKSSKFLLIRNMNEDSLAFIPPGSYANNRYISLISSHIFNKRFPNNNIKPDISDNPIILEYKLNFKDEK